MQQQFAINEGIVFVVSSPTVEERQELVEKFGIDSYNLDSALDPGEIARVEHDPDTQILTMIWKRPDSKAAADASRFAVASVGVFFLHRERIILVFGDDRPPLGLDNAGPWSVAKLLLRLISATIQEFVTHLNTIKRAADRVQHRLTRTLDNRELIHMFDLSEDLVYYVDAIDTNGAALTKLRTTLGQISDRFSFTEDDLDRLDDLLIDNEEISRHGHLYTRVLGGLLDARGNLVNNNMSVLIKNLTVVNVVFLPLGTIASMGGMSEFSRFLDDHHLPFLSGYAVFTLTLVALGFLIWGVVRGYINRRMNSVADDTDQPLIAPAIRQHPAGTGRHQNVDARETEHRTPDGTKR